MPHATSDLTLDVLAGKLANNALGAYNPRAGNVFNPPRLRRLRRHCGTMAPPARGAPVKPHHIAPGAAPVLSVAQPRRRAPGVPSSSGARAHPSAARLHRRHALCHGRPLRCGPTASGRRRIAAVTASARCALCHDLGHAPTSPGVTLAVPRLRAHERPLRRVAFDPLRRSKLDDARPRQGHPDALRFHARVLCHELTRHAVRRCARLRRATSSGVRRPLEAQSVPSRTGTWTDAPAPWTSAPRAARGPAERRLRRLHASRQVHPVVQFWASTRLRAVAPDLARRAGARNWTADRKLRAASRRGPLEFAWYRPPASSRRRPARRCTGWTAGEPLGRPQDPRPARRAFSDRSHDAGKRAGSRDGGRARRTEALVADLPVDCSAAYAASALVPLRASDLRDAPRRPAIYSTAPPPRVGYLPLACDGPGVGRPRDLAAGAALDGSTPGTAWAHRQLGPRPPGDDRAPARRGSARAVQHAPDRSRPARAPQRCGTARPRGSWLGPR